MTSTKSKSRPALAGAAFLLSLCLAGGEALAVPVISINDVSLIEGDSGTTFFDFTVTLSETSADPVMVTGSTADGSALAGEDYTAVTNSIGTFAPGVTSLIFRVFVSGDLLQEDDETFFVNLFNPTNATIGDGQGVGTILTNDPLPVAVPEPGTLALFGVGLVGFGLLRRRRKAG